jgi:hypothetical protein
LGCKPIPFLPYQLASPETVGSELSMVVYALNLQEAEQEDCESEASLGNIARTCLKNKTKQNEQTNKQTTKQ